ncbi:flagellar biosynthesis protein FlhF [Lysobacter yangpyeongensis]|uniref:Flagellar biosynthesis protein FlhF n=1 Tax=Lysobacter yangpyeongensis TaxID=346182 RepID=A0ABW0SJ50_9GAMM
MRIKRFTAPDMRTALRMVREEQGPDAVILSNRATDDGIEIVAATDYDEALAAQALRAAVPGLDTFAPATVVNVSSRAMAAQSANAPANTLANAPVETRAPAGARQASEPAAEPAIAAAVAAPAFAATNVRESVAPRESLITRARAIFRIGDGPDAGEGPTLAELTAASVPQSAPATAAPRRADSGSRFEEMVAAFNPPTATPAAPAQETPGVDATPACAESEAARCESNITADTRSIEATSSAIRDAALVAPAESDADYLIALATGIATPAADTAGTVAPVEAVASSSRTLHAVAGDKAETDPSILAMRRELATMRQLMERQMEQLSLERLRGSPARAAAFETLLALGCDPAIAQSVAAELDPRLPPADMLDPMVAGLLRTLDIAHSEPIDEGGVIALVGPTGAGKTTTAAKLAARFAARHRARDVAMVSIDRERTGAREQLHALGRRLGVTVCDAENSDGLGRALDQLVDYPLVLVDTAGYGVRDRALLRQILWLRSSSRLRSLLVLPANANPHDLGDIARRYRPAAPEGVVLTKLDESGRLGASLSVLAQHQLTLAYTCGGQRVPEDLEAATAEGLGEVLCEQVQELRAGEEHLAQKQAAPKLALEKSPGAAVNPLDLEDRHAFA